MTLVQNQAFPSSGPARLDLDITSLSAFPNLMPGFSTKRW